MANGICLAIRYLLYAISYTPYAIRHFAGIITHGVRGPASNIQKLIQVYEEKKDHASGKKAFEYLKQAGNDLYNNLNELIKLLQWHLENKLPFTACSFDDITDSVLVQLNNIIEQKKLWKKEFLR